MNDCYQSSYLFKQIILDFFSVYINIFPDSEDISGSVRNHLTIDPTDGDQEATSTFRKGNKNHLIYNINPNYNLIYDIFNIRKQ